MSRFTYCQECGDKLRHVAIFCAKCGRPSCSWQCHTQHLGQHATTDVPAAPTNDHVAAPPAEAAATPSESVS